MLLSRRSLLAGLIAAPLVVANSKILMPIKEIKPVFGMYVKGKWLDGTLFNIGIEEGYSAADIGGMDWFDMVKHVDSVEYTDQYYKDLVDNQSVLFHPYRRHDNLAGKGFTPPCDRIQNYHGHGGLADRYYGMSELKEKFKVHYDPKPFA